MHLSNRATHRGFALVVTLSLMMLLTVVAVGLLTISSIALRASGQGTAMAAARANARMALMLAIGDLQKHAGPDQRVTARADLLDEKIANPRLTGVWKSRNTIARLPSSPDFGATAKKDQFAAWLVSAGNQNDLTNQEFATKTASDPIPLWDEGTLGKSAPKEDLVSASRVRITTGNNKGAFSWAAMDEGIKARYNTPYDNTVANDGAKTAQLGSGERPGIEFMSGLDPLSRDQFERAGTGFRTMEKGVTSLNGILAAETLAPSVTAKLRQHTHDLSAYATGLFTDVTTGGLKEDFHLLCESTTLPAPYLGKGVYNSRLGLPGGATSSDPRWESLHEFARLHLQKNTLLKVSNVPVLKATSPRNWSAAANTSNEEQAIIKPSPPPGMVLMPTIAKVQVVFTMLARDLYQGYAAGTVPVPESAPQLHGPWGNNFKGTKYDYLLHMLYTPVVTLHNPYNVALEFNTLKVDFINVPFALQVWRNGIAQTKDLVPLDQMYYSGAEGGTRSKQFGMTMKTKSASGAAGNATFRMLPGEVKIFSPYIDPNRSWANEHGGGSRTFFDYDGGTSDRAFLIDGVPGWRGDGIGFDLDWFCALPLRAAGNKETIDTAGATGSLDRNGCIPLRAQDNLHFMFSPYSIDKAKSKFIVKMSAITPNSPTPVNTGAIELNYESKFGLQDFLIGKGGKMRYPKGSATLNTLSILDHYSTPIKNYTKSKPFAIISAQAKSTYGGFDADNREGRHATKPWVFAHGSIGGASAKVISEHPANHSHELDLIFLEKNTDLTDHLQFDSFDRGNFITGHTGQKGSKFGVMYDIPLAPIQSLSSLNGANPGGSSGYLPRFAQPIGNSWASPMLPSGDFKQAGTPTQLYDHSFLLNTALYDRFYFSGLASQTGNFSSGLASSNLIESFAKGQALSDPRIKLHLPDGARTSDMASKIGTTSATRHAEVAAWQKMEGAFNINSTSPSAWKAMLASIHSSEAVYNKITGAAASALTKLPPPGDKEARISRLRLPITTSKDVGSYWLGPRELDETQLDKLAEAIVTQVRERGPFLSLSEFVNRELGSGDNARSGAIQRAIDLSGINNSATPEATNQINSYGGYEIDVGKIATYNYQNAQAGAGNSSTGAPGSISQADILSVLGNAATARSDTFTIRAYGDSRDATGKVVATAYCEAVVQRQAEYIDPLDAANAVPEPVSPATTLNPVITSAANKIFGRKFAVVSFRWLATEEI